MQTIRRDASPTRCQRNAAMPTRRRRRSRRRGLGGRRRDADASSTQRHDADDTPTHRHRVGNALATRRLRVADAASLCDTDAWPKRLRHDAVASPTRRRRVTNATPRCRSVVDGTRRRRFGSQLVADAASLRNALAIPTRRVAVASPTRHRPRLVADASPTRRRDADATPSRR